MKKSLILDLIQTHVDGNETGFRSAAYAVAREFEEMGDEALAHYISAQLGGSGVFIPDPGWVTFEFSDFFRRIPLPQSPFLIPTALKEDVLAVLRSVRHRLGHNKFLFQGAPGTGKTEAVRHIARLTNRELYAVDISKLMEYDRRLTARNIEAVFDEMNSHVHSGNLIFLFDEIERLGPDGAKARNQREMGDPASTLLRMLDELDERVMLIATANQDQIDHELRRRFVVTVDFSRYPDDDLIEIGVRLIVFHLKMLGRVCRNEPMVRKILRLKAPLPYPGELKNLIVRSVMFGSHTDEYDYLRRLYREVTGETPDNRTGLEAQGFTVREAKILTTA